jgi:hypothetical protein
MLDHNDPGKPKGNYSMLIWGTSLLASSMMFAILFLVIMLVGRSSMLVALGWAGGAALVTMIMVTVTGMIFFRMPLGSSSRKRKE